MQLICFALSLLGIAAYVSDNDHFLNGANLAIVGAGFTPVEADQLRRAMAMFKLTGGVSQFYDKLVGGMIERGYRWTK